MLLALIIAAWIAGSLLYAWLQGRIEGVNILDDWGWVFLFVLIWPVLFIVNGVEVCAGRLPNPWSALSEHGARVAQRRKDKC